MKDDKTIGAFIRKLREEKKLSQEQLASKVNIDRTVFNKWENGRVTIPSPHLKTLADEFDVSVDEILVGERMNADNREKFANIHLELLEKNRKIKKIVLVLFFSLAIVCIAFFGYYFIGTYNKIHVYKITSDSDIFTINNGLFIKARDKIYFELNNTYLVDENQIDKVKVCYKINKEEKCIIETTDLDKISFVDYYGYEEYIPFSDINKAMNNMTIDFILKNGENKSSKLNFNKDYANSNIFTNKKGNINSIEKNTTDNHVTNLGNTYNQFLKLADLDDNTIFKYKYKNVNYNIYFNGDILTIEFIEDEQKIKMAYSGNGNPIFQVDVYSGYEFVRNICTYSPESDECLSNDCEHYDEYLEVYCSVILSFLENESFSPSN